METLPNELRQSILLDIPPSEIIETCNSSEVFSLACDWNFWRMKAQKDFGVSTSYFDLPLETSEGPGSFDEIPFVEGELFRQNVKFSKEKSKLGEGAFRYYQIASRFSLLPQFMVSKNREVVPGFIEPAAFLIRAKHKEQDELIPFLLREIPNHLLASIYDRIFSISGLFQFGMDHSLIYNIDDIGFELLLIENLLHPTIFQEFVNEIDGDFPIVKFVSQIRQGKVPEELKTVIENLIPVRKDVSKFFALIDYLFYKIGHCEVLDEAIEKISSFQADKCTRWLIERAFQKADFTLLNKVMGNEERKTIFENCNRGNKFAPPAYYGGNEEMIQMVDEDRVTEDKNYLTVGYLKNSRPEDYFNIFRKIKRITPELIKRIFSLGDCDILSLCLQAQKSVYEDETPLETAIRFFSEYIEYGLGYLDVIAWVIRVFKTRSEGMGKWQIISLMSPFLQHRIFTRFMPVREDHIYVTQIERLADKMDISVVMLRKQLSELMFGETENNLIEQYNGPCFITTLN